MPKKVSIVFVRVKKIKNNKYAYLVENEWTPWGSRQKVSKYLGKTTLLERNTENKPADLPKNYTLAATQLVIWELLNHKFEPKEQFFVKDDITVDLNKKTVRRKNKPVVLAMNEGFLCDHTIQQLLAFRPEEKHEETAKKLAQTVLEAGLKLPEEAFVQLFEIVPKDF